MKRNLTATVTLAMVSVLFLSLSAHANITYVNYNLSVPTGDLGTDQHTYGDVPYQLPISGIKTNTAPNINFLNNTGTWDASVSSPTNLYGKVTNNDPGETGLGLTSDPNGQHEIWDDPSNSTEFGFVKVDITNILNNNNLLYFHMRIGSAQDHEWFTIWGSNGNSTTGTLLMIGQGGNDAQSPWFDVPDFRQYDHIWVGAIIDPNSNVDHSNIVLESEIAFDQNPVPEPGTLAMMGTAVLGLAGVLRRKLNP